MSANYYISYVGNVRQKDLVGTRHFTNGKKYFTFVMPIADFLEIFDMFHLIYDENSNKMHMLNFVEKVLSDCDIVIYEKELKSEI